LACVGEKTSAYTVFTEKLERDYLEELGIHMRTTLKRMLKKKLEGIEWIQVAWDRDKVRTVVTTVMNARNFSSL